MDNDASPRRLTHEPGEVIQTLQFSADGSRLVVRTEPPNNYQRLPGTVYVWNVADGQILARRPCPTPDVGARGDSVLGFLHDDQTLLLLDNSTVQIAPLHNPQDAGSDPLREDADGISLNHRTAIRAAAVAPDGKTFATMQDVHILLWRVPAEAVHGPSTANEPRRGAEGAAP